MAMFVHAGAGLHGHEYSPRTAHSSSQPQAHQPQPPSRPLPLLRSALRPLSDVNDPRLTADSHARTLSPLAGRRSFSNTLSSPTLPSRLASDIVAKKDLAVRFQEPPMASVPSSMMTLPSDDEESVAGSDASDHTDTSVRRKRRKRLPRKTIRYALAHPAPQLRTKQRMLVQFRPRLLLQLQQVEGRRPTPAFDVLPSSMVAGSFVIPRLAERFPRIFRAKPSLGPDDFLFVRSEDYRAGSTTEDTGHEQIDDRELMAVVCPLPHGNDDAEIIMGDGSMWTASYMPNGSYEFTRVDHHGTTTTARWVRKSTRSTKRATDSTDVSPSSSPHLPENRWTFSIIDPSTRRHPIMGVLTPQELIVYDTYSTMSTSSGRYPPTRPFSGSLLVSRDAASPAPTPTRDERSTETVPEEHRQLMAVTASWINLRLEGWPASSKPKMGRAATHCRAVSSGSYAERRRTFPLSGIQSPHMSSGISQISAEKDGLMTPPPEATIPERRKSTGTSFMRRRRLELESTVRNSEDVKLVGAPEKVGSPPLDEDEKTPTCRVKVREWTQRLFRRKSCKAR